MASSWMLANQEFCSETERLLSFSKSGFSQSLLGKVLIESITVVGVDAGVRVARDEVAVAPEEVCELLPFIRSSFSFLAFLSAFRLASPATASLLIFSKQDFTVLLFMKLVILSSNALVLS